MNLDIIEHREKLTGVSNAYQQYAVQVGMDVEKNDQEQLGLDHFSSHSLTDLSNASLMNRVDTKYVIPSFMLASLLAELKHYYSILEIDGTRKFSYETFYFDTDSNTHYLAHHNGRANRFKIRKRNYKDTDSSFLEVKYRDNHSRTVKTRMLWDGESNELTSAAKRFLESEQVPDVESLKVVQKGDYSRIALANEAKGERLTIDSDLVFFDMNTQRHFHLGQWSIVEVKQGSRNRDSVFFEWARAHQIRQTSFSKYCMGVYFAGHAHYQRKRFHPIAKRLGLSLARQLAR